VTAAAIELSGHAGPVAVPAGALDELAARVEGRLLRPGDPGWDEAVLLWNGLAARTPALGVKGGGHNIAGTAIAEGGLLLDLSGLRQLTVDPEVRLARVGPGCRLHPVGPRSMAA
jgi:hypothetical protein